LLFEALERDVLDKVTLFNPVELVNVAWSFSWNLQTAGAVRGVALFECIAEEASWKMHHFSARELANLAWSYAAANVEALFLFRAIALEMPSKIMDCKSQELAMLTWAYSRSQVFERHLFDAIALAMPDKIDAFNDIELSLMHETLLFLQDERPDHALAKILGLREKRLVAALAWRNRSLYLCRTEESVAYEPFWPVGNDLAKLALERKTQKARLPPLDYMEGAG